VSVTTTSEARVRTGTGVGPRVRWAVMDTLVIAERNLIRYRRIPTLLVFSTVQPVLFVLLFRFVFGNAIRGLPPSIDYVNFLMPGIFVQTAIFGSTQTGVGLAEDLGKGIIDRFRSLPMARSAVLAGRTTADLVRNLFVVLLMTVVGYIVGFRFQAGPGWAILGIVLAVVVGFSFS
jgi:ABC-type multidrug transport system permease subunit